MNNLKKYSQSFVVDFAGVSCLKLPFGYGRKAKEKKDSKKNFFLLKTFHCITPNLAKDTLKTIFKISIKIYVTQNNFIFIFPELQLIAVIFFYSRFLFKLKHNWIFHFQFHFVFIKVHIFAQQKNMDSLTLKNHHSFQI